MSVAGIVLAAGRSTRMGGPNKLLQEIGGKPLVRWVVEAAAHAGLSPLVVVTGHQPEPVAEALAGLDLQFVHNPDYAEGLSTSLRTGVAELGERSDGAVILLGDMPFVSGSLIRRLVAAFDALPGCIASVPVHDGEWGNPVVIARALFPDIARLTGDAGARKLLAGRAKEVVEVPEGDDAVVLDIDTPEALDLLRTARPGPT